MHRSAITLNVTFIDSKLVTPVSIPEHLTSRSMPGFFPNFRQYGYNKNVNTDVIHPVVTFRAQESGGGAHRSASRSRSAAVSLDPAGVGAARL